MVVTGSMTFWVTRSTYCFSGATERRKNSAKPKGGCMNEVCMFTASSTPNQIRSMPSLCATGASSGTTMNDSSK